MFTLSTIESFTQEFAKAISSIIDLEVTIVDNNFKRHAGTGIYTDEIGQKVPHDSFFEKVVKSGKPGIIKDARKEFACSHCKKIDICNELASLAYPIFHKGKTIGVIAIIAFNTKQRNFIIKNRIKLENFLEHMCALLESKIETTVHSIKLKEQLDGIINKTGFEAIVCVSSKMSNVVEIAKKVAPGNASILIRGESGTGKEVLANAIHKAGDRASKQMISVNCAAIPENLVESELFGYDEGAFTGAKKGGKPGKFELANNSTIFLDEIGDMPPSVQVKLLRVLQDGVVERVGGKTYINVNIRVISATHKNLEEMVKTGTFRHDLYYRINVIPINIPPLRERREDVRVLIRHFLSFFSASLNKSGTGIDKDAEELMLGYSWPGNIRELRNIIEYLLNVMDGQNITKSMLPDYFHTPVTSIPESATIPEMLQEYEKKLYRNFFSTVQSVEEKELIAKKLGISIATAYRKLQKYGLI